MSDRIFHGALANPMREKNSVHADAAASLHLTVKQPVVVVVAVKAAC
jgi:hypothetical protein